MNELRSRSFILIAPYAAWIGMMSFLPATALWYAVRGAVTAALLAWSWHVGRGAAIRPGGRGALAGLLAGIAVYAVWVAPAVWFAPLLGFGAEEASPYDPAVCGWTLTCAKLAASALVIPVAEELFFRRWLVDFAGFGWMVVLFAVNHWRWDLDWTGRMVFVAEGAFAGVVYGLLARRFGLAAAILAHMVTNLVLGLQVIVFGQWKFW